VSRLAIGCEVAKICSHCCRSGRLYARNDHETDEGVYEK
jgi:hypothetical protein